MGACVSSEKEEKNNNPDKMTQTFLEDLLAQTKFTEEEIKDWHKAFMDTVPSGKMTFDVYSDLILRTVFRKNNSAVFPNGEKLMCHVDLSFRQIDTNADRFITLREFLIGMSRATKGTPEEKITYAFSLYDMDKDGIISIAELRAIMMLIEKAYGDSRSREEMEKFITFIFNYLDTNKDGVISVTEFIIGLRSEPELLNYLTGVTDTLSTFEIKDLAAAKKLIKQ